MSTDIKKLISIVIWRSFIVVFIIWVVLLCTKNHSSEYKIINNSSVDYYADTFTTIA